MLGIFCANVLKNLKGTTQFQTTQYLKIKFNTELFQV